MTIIILTIIAIIALIIGLGNLFTRAEGPNLEIAGINKTYQNCEGIGFILVGIFLVLLALLFKLNPFW